MLQPSCVSAAAISLHFNSANSRFAGGASGRSRSGECRRASSANCRIFKFETGRIYSLSCCARELKEHAMNLVTATLLSIVTLASTLADAAELKYSIAPNFFEQNPGGQRLGPCHGGAVIDKAGNIYITTDTDRGIVVFSPEGKFLRATGPTRLHGLEVREENGAEYIYAARPSDHEVLKLKLDGERVWTIQFPSEAGIYKDKNAFNPCAVTVGPDGSIFIADGYGANYLLKYNPAREFVKAVGGPGAEEGKFK